MKRRKFIQGACCSVLGVSAGVSTAKVPKQKKTHVITLSFDDGLKKSFYKIADIYERFELRACLNVIATGHLPKFYPTVRGQPDSGIVPFKKGDFEDWNKLKSRGHEVMAHSYDHADLTKIAFNEAKELISKCVDYFEAHLQGFKASQSVYNFAYNASTPELDEYALTKFLAIRTQGDTPINPIPTTKKPVRVGCWSHGPDNIDGFLEKEINTFLDSPGGWFVFNAHGLDDEGWGPMSSKYLTSLLMRLTKIDQLAILPTGEVVLQLGTFG